MLTTVIVLNCLIALACFYVAKKIWNLKRSLAVATRALINAERTTHSVLHGAPEAIARGQMGAYQLRQKYQQLQPQLQKAQRALAVISLGQSLLLGRRLPFLGRRSRRRSPRRS